MTADTTKDRVLSLIVTAGPITATTLAVELGVTSAAIRRHLSALILEGHIVDHEPAGSHVRGRGRPAHSYVATPDGQQALASAYAEVAVDAMGFLRESGELDAFVNAKYAQFEAELSQSVPKDAPMEIRVQALSDALGKRGFATSVRPGPGGYTIQLCQGHCPVQSIAQSAPEWCEAEARTFSRILDVHVQRLSTLARGAHVCTTTIPIAATIPVAMTTRKEG